MAFAPREMKVITLPSVQAAIAIIGLLEEWLSILAEKDPVLGGLTVLVLSHRCKPQPQLANPAMPDATKWVVILNVQPVTVICKRLRA